MRSKEKKKLIYKEPTFYLSQFCRPSPYILVKSEGPGGVLRHDATTYSLYNGMVLSVIAFKPLWHIKHV